MKMTSMKQKLRRYSPDEKVAILRCHLLEQVPVSELCREHDLHPNVVYRWQEEFFEGGAAAFAKESSGQVKSLMKQIRELEGHLARKDEGLVHVAGGYI